MLWVLKNSYWASQHSDFQQSSSLQVKKGTKMEKKEVYLLLMGLSSLSALTSAVDNMATSKASESKQIQTYLGFMVMQQKSPYSSSWNLCSMALSSWQHTDSLTVSMGTQFWQVHQCDERSLCSGSGSLSVTIICSLLIWLWFAFTTIKISPCYRWFECISY